MRGIAVLAAVVVVACVVVALEWYSHVVAPNAAPAPVQAITATPSAAPAATQRPIVYVPVPAATSPSPSPSPLATRAPQTAIPSTSPTASPTPTALNAGKAPAPQAMTQPLATLAPSAVVPRVPVVRERPDAPPRILSMSLSTPVAYSGQLVSGIVQTSSNVASVEARIGGYAANMEKVGVGRFQLSYRVPKLPFFLHRTYQIELIARNTRGDAVTSYVPITVR